MGLPLRGVIKLHAATIIIGILFTAPVVADNIARSFNAKGRIEPGNVVALVAGDNTTVELAPGNESSRIFGVAIEKKDAPVTFEQPGQTIFVATGGTYEVSVSAENGTISPGDYLSMSSVDGIAAKTKLSQTFVIGRAAETYGSSGTSKISAEIIPGRNPELRESTSVPFWLRQIVESLAGKSLSPARIYTALAIFVITSVIVLGLLWIGVQSGMIAIGRNPLSKHSIMQNLVQVIAAAMVVFASGLLGIYLLLRI